MAVTVKNNIVRVTADGDTFAPGGRSKIKGIRLVAGSDAATLTIKETDTSGAALFLSKAAANGTDESRIDWRAEGTLYFALTGTSPVAYIYLE